MDLTVPGPPLQLFGLSHYGGPAWEVNAPGNYDAPANFVQFAAENWTDDLQALNFSLGGHTDLINVSHFFHPVYNPVSGPGCCRPDYSWGYLDVWTTLTAYVPSFSNQVITSMQMVAAYGSVHISIFGTTNAIPEPPFSAFMVVLLLLWAVYRKKHPIT